MKRKAFEYFSGRSNHSSSVLGEIVHTYPKLSFQIHNFPLICFQSFSFAYPTIPIIPVRLREH